MAAPVTVSLSYANKDFESIKADLISKIPQLAPYWSNLNEGDMGMVLLNMVAGVGDMLAFYLDRHAEEMYLPLARSRENVKNIARLIDYRLSRPTAARTTLRFTLAAPLGANLTIPAYTIVKTRKDVNFVTKAAVTLYAGNLTADVEAFQGKLFTDSFTGTGAEIQKFTLTNQNPAQNFLDVKVSGSAWIEDTRDLDYVDAGLYEVHTDANEVGTLVFSRYLGTVPAQSSTINSTYISTLGDRGNLGSGLATILVSTFAGSELLSVTNVDVASGGLARESVESARVKAPRFLRTRNRAVTLRDFEDLLELMPGITKAKAVNHNGYVEIYVAPEGGTAFYMQAPTAFTRTPLLSGGAIPAGTYYVLVTALDVNGGETPRFEYNPVDRAVLDRALSVTVTHATTNQITVTRNALPTGATGWNVYLGESSATMRLVATKTLADTTHSITAIPASPGVQAPERNTTGPRSADGLTSRVIEAEDMLELRRLIGTVFALFNPTFVPVAVTATVKVYDNYFQQDVKSRVETAIRGYFDFSAQEFGKDATVSDLYQVVMDVVGVRTVQFTLPVADVDITDGQIASEGTLTLTMQEGIA